MPIRSRLILLLLFAALSPALAQPAPSLGSAASFAVLGASGVTSSGLTIVSGNAGVSPGSSVAGTSDIHFILGEVRRNDALAQQAQKDNAAAYAALAALPCGTPLTGDLGGRTLAPGVYCVPADAQLTGVLTLDGDSAGVWIFELAGSLTTASCSLVQTVHEAKDSHVFWRIGGTLTLGAKSTFVGNVLALGDITLHSNANVAGRLLSQNGAVTLDDSSVTICCDVLAIVEHTLPNGTPGTPYPTTTLTAIGGKPPYAFAAVFGQLPPGLTFSGATVSGTPTTAGVYKVAIVLSDADGLNCIRVYTITICGGIVLPDLPDPLLCAFYDQKIEPAGGARPFTFRQTGGTLPPDLLLSPEGVLSGQPVTSGPYTFAITATDAGCCSVTRVYTVHVGGEGLALGPETLPNGAVGLHYLQKLIPAGGTEPYIFARPPPGLPPGIELLEDGTLVGFPTAGGCFQFTVTVSSGKCTITRTYTIIICDVPVTFSPPPDLSPATVCTPYCQKISATGCTGPYKLSAGTLPPGLTFDAATGDLCGTPEKPGTYTISVTATGALGCTARATYHLEVSCPAITIDPVLPDANACVYYQHEFPAAGCNGPYVFTANPETLPDGLTLSAGGVLSGFPTTPGDYAFDIIATAKDCPPAVVHVHLRVLCNVTISPQSLPGGYLGVSYAASLTASCGTPPYVFTLLAGAPPPGVTLVNETLSGIPTALGCSTFTIRATDAAGCFADRTYTVCIVPDTVAVPVLSGWGIILLAMFLAAAGFLAMKL
jgi:hypothetical protein